MEEMINKIKNWFKRMFKTRTLQLPEKLGTEVINNDNSTFKKQFKNDLRTEPSDEEIVLINKFENGEISFVDLTEEMRNKILNGYTILINKILI